MRHSPVPLKDSVDKSLELLVQGKLKGPHISGEFELDKVLPWTWSFKGWIMLSTR